MWDTIWEEVFSTQEWGRYPGEELIRFVARNFYQASRRVDVSFLELGCGPGANLWFLAREGFSFCGVDGSSAAIRTAERRLDAECTGWRAHSSLHVGDISQLAFQNRYFDAVIDNEALYCSDFETACHIYEQAARVTKPGGKLFSRTFAEGSWGQETGVPCGKDAWRCAEGPLAGKGVSRFTRYDEIEAMVSPFRADSIELLSMTHGNLTKTIKEWVITATRL